MDQARKGDAALSASKYDEAIQHYTDAISANPTAVKYYINRSTAYQRSSKHSEALADAELAVVLAHKRAVRELIKDAQFRRALALFFLEKYGDAEYVFGIVKELDPKNKMLPMWNMKLEAKLKSLPEDDEKRKVTVKNVPDVEVPSASSPPKPAKDRSDTPAKTDSPTPAPKPVVPTPANKIKVDWYQNNESVTINILAKGIPKEAAAVEIEKESFALSFPISGSTSVYSYNLDPLYAPIEPTQSKYRFTPNKCEVTLKKEAAGVKWHALEAPRKKIDRSNLKAEVDAYDAKRVAKPQIPRHIITGEPDPYEPSPAPYPPPFDPAPYAAPVYPTSSKSGPKNWDKLASDEIDDKDDIEGDETSHFFKKLYKDASADQQRAMMKSYQESGGTVLSTDWGNVGDKTVVPQPPEGMEAKKY